MSKLIIFLGICVALGLSSNLPADDKKVEKIVGCYYRINLKDNNPGPASLCTHIFYSSVGLNEDASVKILNMYLDLVASGFKRFNDLRKKNPQLKTSVNMGDSTIELLTNPTLREKIVNNIVSFVKKYEFNGINLKLTELPKRGGSHSVKENLVSFLKALREKFDNERLILSATVTPNEATANILYDIKGISTYVDFINLRTIDFHGNSDAEKKIGVGHSSPMYPSSKENAEDRKKNIDYVVQYWISQGAPPSKLVLGTTFHGISYTLANPKQIGRGAPFTNKGQIDNATGYDQICDSIKKWNYLYDKEQQVPYIYNVNQIIAYENVESTEKKAEYAEKMKLGGVVVWAANDDDSSGKCGEKFPLLKTLNRVLGNK